MRHFARRAEPAVDVSPLAISSLIGELYGAAANADLWPAFLHCLQQLTHADAVTVLICETDRHYGNCCPVDMPPELAPMFQEVSVWAEAVRESRRHGAPAAKPAHACRLPKFCTRSLSRLLDTGQPDYEACDPLKSGGLLCGIATVISPDRRGLLILRRNGRAGSGQDPVFDGGLDGFGPEAHHLLATLRNHFERAMVLSHQIAELKGLNQVFAESVNAFQTAVLAVDVQGRIRQKSASAASILHPGEGLVLRSETIQAVSPAEHGKLLALLSRATGGRGERGGRTSPAACGAMLISRSEPQPPLRLTVTPFRAQDQSETPLALVFLDDPLMPRNGRGERLRILYGLSPTETRVANLLLEGYTTKEAAACLRLTESSARFYLKKIFRAAGVSTQSGLIRLMLGLPGEANATPPLHTS